MTPQEARKILGLGPADDVLSRLVGLGDARDRIAAMVESAPNETLKKRYRKGLEEFEGALETLRSETSTAGGGVLTDPAVLPPPPAGEAVDPPPDDKATLKEDTVESSGKEEPSKSEPVVIPAASNDVTKQADPKEKEIKDEPMKAQTAEPDKAGPLVTPPQPGEKKPTGEETKKFVSEEKPVPPPAPTVVLGTVPAAARPQSAVAEEEKVPEAAAKPSRALSYLAWFFVFCVGAGGGVWLFLKDQQAKHERAMTRAAFLERQGAIFIENRRWQEAADVFAEVETLLPGSEIAMRGRRSIEVGMTEEQTQFLGYWIGQATAELEAGRLDEAEAATGKVLERFPDDREAAAINQRIAAARETQAQDAAIAAARDALNQRKFEVAIAGAEKILAATPDDLDAKAILNNALLARAKVAADREKAAGLFRHAAELDRGQFDQNALDLIREAASLAPDDTKIAALMEKLSSYTRTLQVPGEFASLDAALASARDRDRIVVAAGTWKGPLVANVAVEIRGAGVAETIVECSPENGSAFTVGPDAKGVRVTGVSFRHESFAVGKDRFSAVLVRGGGATFSDCEFTKASGHGLAVIESGQAVVSRCKFSDNGWNGVAAIGQGSTLEMRDSESLANFEHGVESWDGAAVILVNNRCEGNSRNGIHTDNGMASAEITGNQLVANREFGLVLDSAGNGQVTKNVARENLLGGLVIRNSAKSVRVTSNESTRNHGPGLVLEKGLPSSSYLANSMSGNTGEQLLTGVDLEPKADPPPTEAPAAKPPATPPGMTPLGQGASPATDTQPVIPRAKIVPEP